MTDDHSTYCRKEKEIAEINIKVNRMEKVVMGGNGKGLIVSVPLLAQSVETLNKNVETNNTLTSGVLRFKNELEGEGKAKAASQKRVRWLIGIAVTINLGLLAILVTLILSRT